MNDEYEEYGEEQEIVELIDGDGNEVRFEIIMTFQVDDNDYAALLAIDDEDPEVYLFRIKTSGDETRFEPIEDQEEFDIVAESYNEFF